MNEFESEAPAPPKAKGAGTFCVLSIYLIGKLLWRVLVTAHEFQSRAAVYLGIGFDVLAVIALIALKRQLSKPNEEGESEWTGGQQTLYVLGILAGLGLLALRFHSHQGWWTGHLFFELSPRSR